MLIFAFSINAGCTALPALLNIKYVMQQRQVSSMWNGKDELPVRVILFFIVFCDLFVERKIKNNFCAIVSD